ncbi:Ribonuclease H2 subunit B [Liparis tanakae]|uniref:Ribonuclease H2 subunit B n=1 Tax=Liparis tanakae TaxID=230148 RepID=A0A4Z2END2_9TELE|nr:Ribonuclease H2 subunit B [Liparis tanakae]
MLSSDDARLFEVKAFEEDFHSWFVGQTVQRDGRLLFVTPMDPLFLIMPYLIKSGKEEKFQPVDQVVEDEEFPACSRLLSCTRSLASLHHIAEEKEVGKQTFHRYSPEKTMDWLKKKVFGRAHRTLFNMEVHSWFDFDLFVEVERTVGVLKARNVSVGGGVKSTTYIRVKSESDSSDEDYRRYAHGLISEYLSEDLSTALLQHLKLPELISLKETEPPSKPPKKMTAAQKSLAKVDKTGMKTMASFFSPKVKAEKK